MAAWLHGSSAADKVFPLQVNAHIHRCICTYAYICIPLDTFNNTLLFLYFISYVCNKAIAVISIAHLLLVKKVYLLYDFTKQKQSTHTRKKYKFDCMKAIISLAFLIGKIYKSIFILILIGQLYDSYMQ